MAARIGGDIVNRERTHRWTDPRALAMRVHDSGGLDWLSRMKTGELPPPPIMEALGIQPEEFEAGRIVFSMRAEEWMCNPAVVIHGGMAATLLDTVLTLAVVSKLAAGKTCQTIQMNVNYVRPIFPDGEKITAEGTALHVGTTVGTAEGRVFDARGKLVAHGTATLAVLDTAAMVTKYPAKP
jgi:uncharacterized protein (TIGR00369 family)